MSIWKDASYALGYDSNLNSWHEARQWCQKAGAELASVHTWEINKFIRLWFLVITSRLSLYYYKWQLPPLQLVQGHLAKSEGLDWRD